MFYRQCPQPDCVEQLKDRAVGADAEREGGDGDGGEAGIAEHEANAVAQILPCGIDKSEGVHFVDLFLDGGGVAESAVRGETGLVRRHAAREVIGNLMLEIGLELGSELAVFAGSAP